MSYLLDTHVLLWLLARPDRVGAHVREALADRRNDVVVSAVSAMEIALKHRSGRLDAGATILAGWTARLTEIGVRELAITGEHGVLAGSLSWDHRDPFDRVLVAQALAENLALVTVDREILALPALPTLTWSH